MMDYGEIKEGVYFEDDEKNICLLYKLQGISTYGQIVFTAIPVYSPKGQWKKNTLNVTESQCNETKDKLTRFIHRVSEDKINKLKLIGAITL